MADHDDEIDLVTVVPLAGGGHCLVDCETAWKYRLLERVVELQGGLARFHDGRKCVYVHLAAMGQDRADFKPVEHINGNTLDNRRRNLRLKLPADREKALRPGRRVGNKFWAEAVLPDGGVCSLGTYHTREQAVCAFHYASKLLRGPKAKPNLLDGDKIPPPETLAYVFAEVAMRLAAKRAQKAPKTD